MQEEQTKEGNEQAAWAYKPDSGAPAPSYDSAPTAQASEAAVSWTASEYIANPKNIGWFVSLGLAALLLGVGIYFLTHDLISLIVILIIGVCVGVFAARQPQTLEYRLDRSGIHLGDKSYPYTSFKSFSLVQEGAFSHISLLSLRRFMPAMAIHYAPEDEKKIVEVLADYLPYEEHKQDIIDNFSRRVRF